jgi:hypothetical protein
MSEPVPLNEPEKFAALPFVLIVPRPFRVTPRLLLKAPESRRVPAVEAYRVGSIAEQVVVRDLQGAAVDRGAVADATVGGAAG